MTDMYIISDELDLCINRYGRPKGGEVLKRSDYYRYKKLVPEAIFDFWMKYGTGTWLDGRFQFVRPDKYADLVTKLLEGDPEFPASETVAIGYSAFGRLLLWNNVNYMLEVDLVRRIAYTEHVDLNNLTVDPDLSISLSILMIFHRAYDYFDMGISKPGIFERFVEANGPLAYGECLAFKRAEKSMRSLEYVHRAEALAHFNELVSGEPIALKYINTDLRRIYNLGRNLGGST